MFNNCCYKKDVMKISKYCMITMYTKLLSKKLFCGQLLKFAVYSHVPKY